MWKLRKPRKIKARILFLSIVPIASLAFISSCSNIFIKKPEKPEVIKGKRIKVKIKDFQFSFGIEKKHDNFGLIKSVEDADKLFEKIRNDSRDVKKDGNRNFRNSKQKFIEFFKIKYNKEFFENNDLIFWYVVSGTLPFKTIVDNVTLNNNTLTINAMYLSRLRREFHDIRIVSTAFENWFHLITVNKKENKYDKVEINRIDTLKKFKDYTSKDYRDNYDEKNSKIENKEFNTYG